MQRELATRRYESSAPGRYDSRYNTGRQDNAGPARQETSKNKPLKKFRAGPVSATIWENQGKNVQGEAINYKTVSFERSYKDATGAWQTTNALRMTDLPKATLVLNKAYEFLAMNEEDE